MYQQQYFDNSVSTFGKKKKNQMKFPLGDLKTSAKVTFKIAFSGMPAALTPGVFPFVSMSFSIPKLWQVCYIP